MGTYATYSDVGARTPARTIDATSMPTATQVSAWVDEGEALLGGALSAGQITIPITDASGIKLMRSWTCDYAEAHLRMAWASTANDGNPDGQQLLDRFNATIDDIYSHPSRYQASLWSGASSESTRRVRGYVLDNDDSKSITNGDFAPEFEKGDVF